MFKSRTTRFVWAINGYLFLLVLVFALWQAAKEVDTAPSYPDRDQGLLVGEPAERARSLDIVAQHFHYERPRHIENSPYSYVSVYALDKALPEQIKRAIESAGDVSMSLIGSRINVVFFNQDQTYTKRLLPHNGYVDEIEVPSCAPMEDHTGNCVSDPRNLMLYRIATRDTNGDGRIGDDDIHAYYTSDVSGENLNQITPDTLDLWDAWYASDFSKIFFTQLIEDPDQQDAYGISLKTRNFYSYSFDERRFSHLDGLARELARIETDYKSPPAD